jgi:hypothetical protein
MARYKVSKNVTANCSIGCATDSPLAAGGSVVLISTSQLLKLVE